MMLMHPTTTEVLSLARGKWSRRWFWGRGRRPSQVRLLERHSSPGQGSGQHRGRPLALMHGAGRGGPGGTVGLAKTWRAALGIIERRRRPCPPRRACEGVSGGVQGRTRPRWCPVPK